MSGIRGTFTVIVLILAGYLLVNGALVLGALGWLKWTDRWDRQRFHKAAQIFQPTLAQEKQKAEEEAKAAEEEKVKAAQTQWMESVVDGPSSVSDRLSKDRENAEVAEQRVERLQREIQDLRRRLDTDKQVLVKQAKELEESRKAFAEQMQKELKLKQDADFQQAVQTYEQLPAKQAKQMFQQLLAEKKQEDVVNYLAAMKLRKAAAVLKEFKTPEEIPQAADLVQRLRQRGVDPFKSSASPTGDVSS